VKNRDVTLPPDDLDAQLEDGLRRCEVPTNLHAGLLRYLRHGVPTGGFLRAVLENDLADAVRRADPWGKTRLHTIVEFLDQYAPGDSYGSPDAVATWVARHQPNRRTP
jgi:hypothetical protein